MFFRPFKLHRKTKHTVGSITLTEPLKGALEFMYPSLCVHCRVPWSSCVLTVCTLQGALEFMYPSLCVHCRVPWSSCIPHCVYIAGCLGVHVSLTVCTLQGALEFMYPDDRFHIIHDDREYDIFGHGGMLFWFFSSVFFFVVSNPRNTRVQHWRWTKNTPI